ncbi:MAG: hypothetical protein Kow0031_39760 [Anaerolineae bacterium]
MYQIQKMETIGRLAGGIAHDFNNLLVPILGYAELGMMILSPEHGLYKNFSQINTAAQRAADLTRQILAYSRRQVLNMQALNLNQVIGQFESMLHRIIGEDIELHTFFAPTPFPVKADRTQLEQVIMNLVVNARDAMPRGGKLSLETANVYLDEAYVEQHAGIESPGYYVMLAVSDTGHGMDASTKNQIFDPFFTTKAAGKGTGMGLSTVLGIVKQHQGHIWVYSEPGGGTTFKIYLPRAEGEAWDVAPHLPEPVSLFGTETILVVEDNELLLDLACETLHTHRYQILRAGSSEEALELAATYPDTIHLLLTDVVMPGMNGRVLFNSLAKTRPAIKVLFMSGYTDNVIVHHGILEQGVNFLQKPFNTNALVSKVRSALDQQPASS